MNARYGWRGVALVAVAAAIVLEAAQADDLQPPPWRGGALSTVAEWDFLTPGAGPPDGTSVTPVVGDAGGVPLAIPGSGINWSPFDGTGAWTGAMFGGTLGFEIPNWIDQEPIKYLQIQMTYDRGPLGLSPFVLEMNAFDPAGILDISLTGAVEFAIPNASGLFQRIEQWEIRPNPDNEYFVIAIPDGVSLSQVVVDTISVPEPSTIVLGVLGALSLITIASRRRATRGH